MENNVFWVEEKEVGSRFVCILRLGHRNKKISACNEGVIHRDRILLLIDMIVSDGIYIFFYSFPRG